MVVVHESGEKMTLRDDAQLSAFLNSGWSLVEDTKPEVSEETPKKRPTKKV